MSINDRVREIRNALDLTQKEFGQRLAIAQSYLTNIETGKREVTEKIQKLICLQFNVNEEWLRTGGGEMFVEDDNVLIAQLSKQYSLDAFSRRFIETYVKLPEAQREVIKNFAFAVAAGGSADVEISAELSPAQSESHVLTEAEIEAETESYRRELEQEKRVAEKSSVSGGAKEA